MLRCVSTSSQVIGAFDFAMYFYSIKWYFCCNNTLEQQGETGQRKATSENALAPLGSYHSTDFAVISEMSEDNPTESVTNNVSSPPGCELAHISRLMNRGVRWHLPHFLSNFFLKQIDTIVLRSGWDKNNHGSTHAKSLWQ